MAITTRADENIKSMTDLTFPIIKNFCKKWNSDFIVLDQNPIVLSDDNLPHFRIMKLYDLLNQYDRIISLDSDIVINKNCPNLFKIVPEDCIGTIYEDQGSRKKDRIKRMYDIQNQFGNINWNNGYINTGVFCVSKIHQNIFTSINDKYYTKNGSDDVHIGYQIVKMKFKVKELNYKFNHMSMFSESWNGNPSRFDSFIIHYAGKGIFNLNMCDRLSQIKNDINIIYG